VNVKQRDEAGEELATMAAVAAVDDSRLLEGEDPSTDDPEAVGRWAAIYAELLAFKRDVAFRIRAEHDRVSPPAKVEVLRDLQLIERQSERLQRRLSFWRGRQLRLGTLPGRNGLELGFGGRSVRLSRREAELLAFLARHPDRVFGSAALAAQAWHDSTLRAAQVRNYVSRLRQKLEFVAAPCRIDTVEGGYRVTWTDPELV
jgi:DNA-binding response OmpR family regulator